MGGTQPASLESDSCLFPIVDAASRRTALRDRLVSRRTTPPMAATSRSSLTLSISLVRLCTLPPPFPAQRPADQCTSRPSPAVIRPPSITVEYPVPLQSRADRTWWI